MKRTVRTLLACAAVAIAIPFSATPASAGCSKNPPPPEEVNLVIFSGGGDLVAVCSGDWDKCEAAIAICL